MNSTDPSKISRDLSLLSPFFQHRLEKALATLKSLGHNAFVFEAMRSPERQDWLYQQGRTRPGKIVTRAKAGESWHQHGLAVDIALFDGKTWSWDFKGEDVAPAFLAEGLETLKFEAAHFQMTRGLSISEAQKIHKERGLEALWQEIEKKI